MGGLLLESVEKGFLDFPKSNDRQQNLMQGIEKIAELFGVFLVSTVCCPSFLSHYYEKYPPLGPCFGNIA
jgi:hypothetical protein